MTIEQLEKRIAEDTAELGRLKAVKPKASLEAVFKTFEDLKVNGHGNFSLSHINEVFEGFDWTSYEKPLWMRELVEGMPCLWRMEKDTSWMIGAYHYYQKCDQIPFDEDKIGKVTE